MIKQWLIIGLCLLTFPLFAATKKLSCKVVRVSDGDTITCLTKQKKSIKIRLANIDAPETHQDFGLASKKALIKLIAGKQVQVAIRGQDRYRRTLGTIYYRAKNINLQMVKLGMAWVYTSYNKSHYFIRAQQTAKQHRVGLWRDKNPTPPWEFRKKQNKMKR